MRKRTLLDVPQILPTIRLQWHADCDTLYWNSGFSVLLIEVRDFLVCIKYLHGRPCITSAWIQRMRLPASLASFSTTRPVHMSTILFAM